MKHEMHGKRNTRLYRIWANIKTRCYNPRDPHFPRWGGKGVKMCDEWKNSFNAFYLWAINNRYTDELTIDRIDNNGDYTPLNCRWVTVAEQNQNKKNVILLTYSGVTLSCAAWSKKLNLGKDTIRQRYIKGWSIEECLFGKRG